MPNVTLDIEIIAPQDAAGRAVIQAIQLLAAGDRPGAEESCRRALAGESMQASTWCNLSAYALMSGDVLAAKSRARRALDLAPASVEAMVNLSDAIYGAGDRDAAMAILGQAIALRPGHAKALANYGMMLSDCQDFDSAAEILRRAALANPGSAGVARERAVVAHSIASTETTRQLALNALVLSSNALPATLTPSPRKAQMPADQARLALCAAHNALTAAGQKFYLMAGTLLGLVRDGDLIAHDKDMDLALPFDTDREQVAKVFERHGDFRVPARPAPIAGEPLWAFGVIHLPSATTIDLFFAEHAPDGVRFGFGLPPRQIFCKLRPYELGSMKWQGRDWAIPSPAAQYLADVYGPQWQTPDPYFDTALSNPSRLAESLPRAINLGLLRLGDALRNGDWLRAHSLCAQLLARESMAEVATLKSLLSRRCPALSGTAT